MLRKRSIAIFFSVLLTGLLAGNMAGYVLCRFATAEETTVQDCGCDIWLNGSQASAEADGSIHAGPVKTVSPDSLPPHHSSMIAAFSASPRLRAPQVADPLLHRPANSIFHPPAVC